jgi:hypothetical protein
MLAGQAERIGGPPEFERHGDIFERRHGGNQMEGLEDDADRIAAEAGERILILAGERRAVDSDGAGTDALEAGNHHQQGGLAGTRRPDNAERLACFDGEINAAQYVHRTGAARQSKMNVFEADNGGGHLA